MYALQNKHDQILMRRNQSMWITKFLVVLNRKGKKLEYTKSSRDRLGEVYLGTYEDTRGLAFQMN